MAEETLTPQDTQTQAADSGDPTPVANPDGIAEQSPPKLQQKVEITDAGPCKKHVKVIIDRAQIDARFEEKFSELMLQERPQVRGFRPGKAPRKLIERQFRDQVAEEIKRELLMASLEQLANDHLIAPISPPNLDPFALSIPPEGPFIYEFDVEVRPEFDLPPYKGLKIRRPVHTFTAEEIEREKRRLLEPHGQIVPKEGDPPVAEYDDYISGDLTILHNGNELRSLKETQLKVEPRLVFKDGVSRDFGEKVRGASPGETREFTITLSDEIPAPQLRGQTLQARLTVHEVKTVRLPDLTPEFLENTFGVRTPEALDEYVRTLLERRLELIQRQQARQQVLELLAGSANWELPQDLLRRQARKVLQRHILEMQNAGLGEEQIQGRMRMLQMEALRTTARDLKEHFVLQKIAEAENIEITDEDIDAEIERLALRQGVPYRKMKARVEKEDLAEVIAAQLLERRALDLILAHADYEDYEWKPTAEDQPVATMTAEAAPAAATAPAETTGSEPNDTLAPPQS